MRENGHISSVERGLRILETIGSSPEPLSLTEIARRADLKVSTAQRFVQTLATLGYIHRNGDKRYALGTRVLSLGFQFLNSSSLVSMARPYLDELSTELQTTVNLAVLDQCDVLILYRREIRKFMKFDVHPGSKLLAYGSALGRVLMAALPDGEIVRRVREMEIHRLTPRTTVSREANLSRILEAREKGYAVADREMTMDLCSIAAPVNEGSGATVAAINVSVDVMRMDEIKERAKEALLAKGRLISRNMGYEGPYPQIGISTLE